MNPSVLESKKLTIGYSQRGKIEAVASNINIKLEEGKLTCLMGPNGIGKSTLIKTITGVLPPISGSILIKSQDLFSLDRLNKAQTISVVLTDKPTSGFMTVRDLISLGRYPYTSWQNKHNVQDQIIVDAAIEAVGLGDSENTPLIELSDGNLQKAIIGRSLAQDTEIIVLDEPTVHLDVNNKTMIIKLLRQLCRNQGKTILLSTHDLELAMTFADRLWLFADGVIYDGLPEDLALSGKLNSVFTELNPEDQNSIKDNIKIKGDEATASLLKKAISKSILDNQYIQLDDITILNEGNQIKISYKGMNYQSIEEFINSLNSD